MPRLNDGLANYNAGSFGFSAERIEHLEATEFTLVTIQCDKSGSIAPFQNNLNDMIREIVMACRESPRADNLMLRLVTFNHDVVEEHGFKLLMNCNPDDYIDIIRAGGNTALYDATYSSVSSTLKYAEELKAKDFAVNGILYVVTDGLDSGISNVQPHTISDLITKSKIGEQIESFTTILVGVNTTEQEVVTKLSEFKDNAKLDSFINMGDATKQKIAKLAGFVSQSVISTSTSLATGQASTVPSFTF